MKTVIKISPGGDAISLYQDDHPLLGVGNVDLARASNVVWENQEWRIKLKSADGSENDIGLGFTKRSDAIAFEVRMLNHLLATDPDQAEAVKILFKKETIKNGKT